MPEDIGMTLIFLIIIMVMIIMAVFIFLRMKIPVLNGQLDTGQLISYSIDFVSIANKPFLLSEVLSHAKLGDRQLLETSIEAAAAGSLHDASADSLEPDLYNFVKPYNLKNYYISINSGGEIAKIQSTEFKCGDNFEGWCVLDGCDVGRVEINGMNKCVSQWQKCCKEDPMEYARTVNKFPVVTCENGKGICSEGTKSVLVDFNKPHCTQNRVDLGVQPECDGVIDANGNKATVCCAPKTEENEISNNVAAKAIVPLLYKNLVYGTLEVTVR